jgi:peptidoglycan/LPS O-acetylase OafA/YrhL
VQEVVQEERHLNTFDFLRLFAATTVVVQHATFYFHANFLWDRPNGPYWFYDGVGMFFVMSGLLVYRSADNAIRRTGTWKEYFRNRFLRVAPAIYAYTLVMAVVAIAIGVIPLGQVFSRSMAVWLGTSVFLLPGHEPAALHSFGTGELNGSLWTIPAEVRFYLVVPLLYLLARRIGINRMLLLFVPIAIIAPILADGAEGHLKSVLDHTYLQYIAFFMAGIFWSAWWKRVPHHWSLFATSIAAYIVTTRLLPDTVDAHLHSVLAAATLSYAILWFGYEGPKVLAGFTHRVGDLSFGTYIWHMPLVNFIIWAGWPTNELMVFVALFGSWGLASASWWLVERPAQKRKRVSERVRETGQLVAS